MVRVMDFNSGPDIRESKNSIADRSVPIIFILKTQEFLRNKNITQTIAG